MMAFRVEAAANVRLDEIYDYTADRWGEDQADAYISALFDEFGRIARQEVPSRKLPADFGFDGYQRRWRSHMIYWKLDDRGDILIVAILHERMHQIDRLRDDLAP